MSDFVKDQWDKFCDNLKQTATHLAGDDKKLKESFWSDVDSFRSSRQPDAYPDLLELIAEGTGIAVSWRERSPLITADSQPTGIPANDPNDLAYQSSERHSPGPAPKESIAEQAEQAKSL